MNTDIRYIFLDLGGTFRVIDKDPAYLAAARAKIAELCGVKTENPTQWFEDVIDKRYDVYREWALNICARPRRRCCGGAGWPMPRPELIRATPCSFRHQYRQTRPPHGGRGRRRHGEGAVPPGLHSGHHLGSGGQTGSGRVAGSGWLRPYFQTVQQSSVTYIRKPGPAIYYYAMEEVGAEPENCCYVGDNLNRDIIGAKAVDFGMTVTVQYQKDKPLKLTAENRPDAKVYRFPDLLDIFPKRGQVAVEKLIPPEDGQ